MAKKRILIADDEPDLLFITVSNLERPEWKIVTTENGEDTMNRLENDPPYDIIILDVLMPEPNGLKIAEYIKRQDELKHIPIVIHSAMSQGDMRDEAARIGVERFVTKPIDWDKFRQMIEDLLT